ncbi:MAG TPA: DUF6279 family lipoprotein [Ramlibacter sp.]|jgi:hypothetical protein|uniref:DUF6279 family lipoprotein n=1 Tax=Ramlibacter sp. TaxID=1917967 RepID=UPI002D5B3669|nr:DUF6279 family lipoprotein [Ramlibacter sp.]HZY18870.1 DUF6279 family lipoprotein [Ramlibacter sp.]
MSFPSILLRTAPALARIIGLLSLAVALGGCSAIKLGYASLPEVGYWWLDGYLDFDDDQQPRMREDLARVHAWHRAEELPRIVQLLQSFERLAPAEVTADQACSFEPALRERFTALRQRVEPVVAGHALALTPAQLEHLERKFTQRNREFQNEWVRLSAADLLDKRLKAFVERAETVYGSLGEPQRTAVRQQLEGSAYNPAAVLAERRRRQQDTLAVLRRLAGQGAGFDEARLAVRGLFDRLVQSPDAGYRAYVDTMRQETCRSLAAVHRSTTAAQRDHAARRLRGWQRDLTELSLPQ